MAVRSQPIEYAPGGSSAMPEKPLVNRDRFTVGLPDIDTRGPSFTLFMALPAELRLQVWEQLVTPRVVSVDPSILPVDISDFSGLAREERPCMCPPLLHTCRESRQVALRHYEPAFSPMLYFNFERDTLWHSREGEGLGFDCPHLARVRRLALSLDDLCDHDGPGRSFSTEAHISELLDAAEAKLAATEQLLIVYNDQDMLRRHSSRGAILSGLQTAPHMTHPGAVLWQAWAEYATTTINVQVGRLEVVMVHQDGLQQFINSSCN